jgi:RNA-directed DNA polymerase
MSAREKSGPPEVAEKRANKAALAAAEPVERRGGAKENAELQSTVRTQSRAAVSQEQARIREAVIRNRRDKLTALLHHLTCFGGSCAFMSRVCRGQHFPL